MQKGLVLAAAWGFVGCTKVPPALGDLAPARSGESRVGNLFANKKTPKNEDFPYRKTKFLVVFAGNM